MTKKGPRKWFGNHLDELMPSDEAGANYEDEPMDIGELLYEEYDEEGEIHSSGDERNEVTFKTRDSLSVNVSDSAGIFHRFPEEGKTDELKKLERAKRFAIPLEKCQMESVNSDSLTRLHATLGIDKENERHYRFNAIHVRGTQDMSTEDVFEYFTGFSPLSIEWINDVSCNVIWVDDVSAARALLNLSKEIKNLDRIRSNGNPFEREMKDRESDVDCCLENDAVDAREISAAIPPGKWRVGVPTRKSSAILLRFANRNDHKQKYAEKNSEYYKRYGNPHFGNIPGLVSKSLRSEIFRRHKKITNHEDGDDNYNVEEYDKSGRKNPWGHIAHEWKEQDTWERSNHDARSRISLKRQHDSHEVTDLRMSINNKNMARDHPSDSKYIDISQNSSQSDNDDDFESRVKFPRMKMYADEEEELETSSHRKLSSLVVASQVEDLRNKINRKKRTKKMMVSHGSGNRTRLHHSKYNSTEDEEDYEDERDSSHWALEQYSDLRESLEHNKKYKNLKNRRLNSDSEENEDDISENASDDAYKGQLGHRSPLQIEIENDEYFENESDNTL